MIVKETLTFTMDCGHDLMTMDWGIGEDPTEFARTHVGIPDTCRVCRKDGKVDGFIINRHPIYMSARDFREHNYPMDTWLDYTDISGLLSVRNKYGLEPLGDSND